MNRLFILYGIRRSGIHAVVNWLAAHFPGLVMHYDNVTSVGGSQWTKSRGVFYFEGGKHVPEERRKQLKEERHITSVGILNTEDLPLDRMLDLTNHKRFGEVFGAWERIMPFFLFRSYENMIASRYKKSMSYGETSVGRRYFCPWKGRELYIAYRDHATKHKCRTVSFDRWFADWDYRRSLESKFLLRKNIDGDMDFVTDHGDGSSFDRQSKPGTEMSVLERASQVELPEELRKL